MGKALAAVGGLLVVCFAVLGLVIFLSRDEDAVAVDQVLAEELTRRLALAGESGDPVEVDAVTAFEWDELLVFARRTPRAAIDDALGFEFKGELPYDAESQELFVFVDDGRLARFADYRGRGTFEGIERPVARFTPDTAVFRVSGQRITPAG